MADPVRPLLDGGASAVEDNKPGRKASGETERASGTPAAVPSAQSSPEDGAGSPAPLTAKTLTDAQSLMADELPDGLVVADDAGRVVGDHQRSEEHTSELQSQFHLVCRLLLEKKNKKMTTTN